MAVSTCTERVVTRSDGGPRAAVFVCNSQSTLAPAIAMRFLCDEMLGRLARYLRAAGYDTVLAAGGAPDRAWLAQAEAEGRLFLTCDRRIAEHRRAERHAVILPRGSIDRIAAALSAALHVDWLHAPFTRCLVDNTPLAMLTDEHRARLPPDVAATAARHCPACGRVYWAGSHYRRMRHRLATWAQDEFE